MTTLYVTSIEMDFSIHTFSDDPKIFDAVVYCENSDGVKLSFKTLTPAAYFVGEKITLEYTAYPSS